MMNLTIRMRKGLVVIDHKAPVEIAGYIDRRLWTVDTTLGTAGFRWWSCINDDYLPGEFLPWEGDSSVDDCPF
jgi:hypothetical protein